MSLNFSYIVLNFKTLQTESMKLRAPIFFIPFSKFYSVNLEKCAKYILLNEILLFNVQILPKFC